ncbi:hypothetical protein TNCV_3410961 [Trichonephila clavipes]|nr:hypothetical protein TNCV_3410961 [Trichonephila clavipes]
MDYHNYVYDVATKCCRHGNLMVKVTDSWPECHEFKTSATEDPSCRGLMHFKAATAQTSPHWCDVVVRRGGVSSGVVLIT